MPGLSASLQKHDLGYFLIVAGFWGFELESSDSDSALEELCASLLDLEAVSETLEILPAEARGALTALAESSGKMEWVAFARKYGEIREMGAGRRDREHPHLKPTSISEILFYRGVLAKAFFDTEKGAQEFAYIPDDLFEIIEHIGAIGPSPATKSGPLGRPATPVEKAHEIPATDHILDDATTHLAALRIGGRVAEGVSRPQRDLQELLNTAGLIKKKVLQPEAVKNFLEAARPAALTMLYNAWLASDTFDELRLVPSLVCEGEWKNQPQVTREFLLDLINDIPQGKWWSLPAFLRAIKEKFPDFQRPAGDYDSWFIKRESDGQFLRGFAYWDAVDGALVTYLIQVLHWLGRVDLASPEEGQEFMAFKILSMVESQKSGDLQPVALNGKINVSSNGRIVVSRHFSRAVRYQISRFCEWDNEKGDDYIYSVSARSLKRAHEQGLKAEQLLALLVKYTNGAVPPAMVKALKRWDANGAEARVESLLVLRVSRPEVMEEMRKSRAGKFLGELLSPTAVVVKSGAIEKVLAALAELGLLAEVIRDDSNHDTSRAGK
ncbi:MAG: helicase-associated domain-containing protein [Anaerolineales bacterium]|nr:MAG: helicase-associated domain-containing protein [Anaerolineales bacterium]